MTTVTNDPTAWQRRMEGQDAEWVEPPASTDDGEYIDDPLEVAEHFADATRPEEPEIRKPGESLTDLFYGLGRGEDRYRTAEVRELNGRDEEALSKLDVSRDDYYPQLQDTILRRAVVRIGDIDVQANPKVVGDLLMGDRDILFMSVLIATYGEEKHYEDLVCPSCEGTNDVDVHIPSIINKVGSMLESDTFEVKLRDGSTIELRYPTGTDQLQVLSEKKGATDQERNSFMLQRCIVSNVGNPREFVLSAGMADRRAMVDALGQGPRVEFKEVKVPCSHCNEILPFMFSWADLLLV